MSGDSSSKSQKATPKRMKQLRHDGSLQRSQDLSAWVGMGAAALTLTGMLTAGSTAATAQLNTVRKIIANPDPALAVQALFDGGSSILPTIAPMLGVVVVTAILATAVQGGIYFSTKKLKPTFKQFNVVTGLKRVFGMQAWWQGLKALLKTMVVGWVLYVVVKGITPMLLSSGGLSLNQVLGLAGGGVSSLMRSAVAAGLVLAVFDLIVIRRTNRKQTMMSTEEIKQENKSSEGDPLLKSAIRSKQMAMSRNRRRARQPDARRRRTEVLTRQGGAARRRQGVGARRGADPGRGDQAAHPDGRGRRAGPGAEQGVRDRPGDPRGPVRPGRQDPGVRDEPAPPGFGPGPAHRPPGQGRMTPRPGPGSTLTCQDLLRSILTCSILTSPTRTMRTSR